MPILPALLSALIAAPAGIRPAQSANYFGLELHRVLPDTGNLFLSPSSVHAALAMSFAGARGATENEMARTLRFGAGQAAAHADVAELGRRLDSIAASGKISLERANAIWSQRDMPVVESFLAIQKRHYAAGFQRADFAGQPEAERRNINRWAEEKTRGRIKDLIPPGIITPLTAMVLCNSIWFKGRWATPFDSSRTAPGDFHLFEGKKRKLPMMSLEARFRHAAGDGWAALDLPYAGGELSMVVLLPDATGGPKALKALETSIGREGAKDPLERLGQAEPERVKVFLPRFKLTCGFELIPYLQKLGMKEAFGDNADFSGMFREGDVRISAVIHKAFVEVNEEGSEAAAATAVVKSLGAGPSRRTIFRADRPFVFVIRENRTGLILFSGRVTDPGT